MKKLLLLGLVFALSAAAEILPERLGDFNLVSLNPAPVNDADVYAEFDYEQGEIGEYETADGRKCEITAWRFYDDTGAYAAYLWNLPEDGAPDSYGERAWVRPGQILIHFGNYVVDIRGDKPEDEHIEQMMGQYFPSVRMSSDPPVLAFLPTDGVAETSERYILGPTTLARLAPEVPPSVAGFHFGTEAIYAKYPSASGDERLALFSYPTPQMAREQIEQFYALENVVAKRDGSVIATVLSPPNADDAQRLLAKFNYRAEVTVNYKEPDRHDNLGVLLLDVVISCLILIGLCILGGILVAGARIFAARVAPNSIFAAPDGDSMTRLRINEKDPGSA